MEIRKQDPVLRSLLHLLILSAFTSGVILETGIVSLNLSQLIAVILFLLLIVYSVMNREQSIVLYKDAPSLLLYLYFLINLFSSIFFSDVKGQSLRGCALILTYILIYVCVRWALKFMLDKPDALKKLLQYNNWSAVFGLLCMLLSLTQGGKANIGVSLGQLRTARIETVENPLPSIQSLSVEPNLFAIITAVLLCINLSVYLLSRKSQKQLWVILLLSAAVLFSYTRSVYLSLGIALVVLVFLSKQVTLIKSMLNYIVIILVLITALMIFLPKDNDIKNALVSRVSTLIDFKGGSGAGRVMGYQIGLEGFRENPIFGKGTLSADTEFYNPYRKQYQQRMGSAGWLNGVLIQSMHDTGIVGIIIDLALFASIFLANFYTYKKFENGTLEKSILLGFMIGNIVLFISSQASSTLWIAFPYVYWGLNMGYIKWCREKLQRDKETEPNLATEYPGA